MHGRTEKHTCVTINRKMNVRTPRWLSAVCLPRGIQVKQSRDQLLKNVFVLRLYSLTHSLRKIRNVFQCTI